MRIGILTLNGHYNYGNRLQNYALQTLIESLHNSIEVETVWYTKDNYVVSSKNKMFTLKNIRRYLFNRHGYRYLIDSNAWAGQYIREYNIKNSVIDI